MNGRGNNPPFPKPPGQPHGQPRGPRDYCSDPRERSQFNTIIWRISQEGSGVSPIPTGETPHHALDHHLRPGMDDPLYMEATHDGLPHTSQGHLLAFFGCKGGVGNTFGAVNLAASLARASKVCLMDMDLQMGDVLVSLNMEGRCAISHFCKDIRTEGANLNPRNILDRHTATGVYVLSQTHCLEELDCIAPSEVTTVIQFLRQRFPYIIVDGLRGFDDNSMLIMDAADTVFLLVTQDVPSIRSAARSLEIFRRIGYDDAKVAVIVNRYSRKAAVTPNDIIRSLKLSRIFTIRDDEGLVVRSLNEGQPLQVLGPQRRISRDLDALAETVSGSSGHGGRPSPKKRGLFSWFS